ncbi:MAG: DUF4411 family protein [Deltaproteobacteria bacterium]|nr:DUF4411 family protein [Deltaproteobacteria bacterium]
MYRGLFSNYCIDTSSLIDLKNYPREFFHSLWEEFENLIGQTVLISPREVYREIERYSDDIYIWATKNIIMFHEINETEQLEVRNILEKYPNLIDFNKTTPDADPFVIAIAKHRKCTVITQEKYNERGKPKIPNVCKDYNINCIDLLAFLENRNGLLN